LLQGFDSWHDSFLDIWRDSNMRFPWSKGKNLSLTDLVKSGLPAKPSPEETKKAAKQAAAEARREAVYDTRARKCAAELQRVAALMSPAEFARYGKRLDMAAKTALKQKSSSKDLRLDLGDILPLEIAQRAGLPVDADAVPVVKDFWRNRAPYPAGLVRDDQPAANSGTVITAEDIVNAAKRARGGIPPEKQLDPGKSVKPSERWLRK
jgi:hypothetical protein